MGDPEVVQRLERLEAMLSGLLAVTIDRHLRDGGLAKPRPRAIDQILFDAGLTVAEIGHLLGKTPQAVYLVIGQNRKTRKGHQAEAATAADEGPSELPPE